jgi:CRISPR-associated protein Cmr6
MGSRRSSLQTLAAKGSTNAGLWLNKFIGDQKTDGQETTAKQNLVQEVSEIAVPPIYESFYKDIWLKSLLTSSEIRFIKIEGRMIVGLGADSVLETSITLHRTYGVPYIPGSALKGLAASYAHRFMGEDWRKETKTNAIGKAHEIIFGSQNSAGFVNFIDALYVPDSYVRKPKRPLEPDILTVHHSKYYQGEANSAPADWDSPVPIPLLSAQGKYLLAISADSGDKEFDKKLKNLAIDILEYALRDEGIGAKTSSGYGRASLEYLPLTQEEKEQQQIERQENKLHGIAERLEAIGNYEKESKDRFKVLAKELRKLTPPLKKEGATLLIERVRIVSQLDDDVLENAEWFVEVKKMTQD